MNQEFIWPQDGSLKTMERYTRYEDMSPDGSLTILIEEDGDVIVDVQGRDMFDRESRASVQFCTVGGGGQSMGVRKALLNLALAIIEDNKAKPQYRERTEEKPKAAPDRSGCGHTEKEIEDNGND